MKHQLIHIRELTKTYRISTGLFRGKHDLRAVNGVTLEVEQGTVFGLVGESGCGKTTLSKLLLGLEQRTGGEILFNNRPTESIPRRDLARHIQPVFQDPYSSLNPRKSVASIISLPLKVHRVGTMVDWSRRVQEIMDVVGLPPRLANSYPGQLSGGQRQRVAVARALIMHPDVVVCDEPTSALDVSVQSQILNMLMDLRSELGLTYILISHNLSVVEHMASRVAVMYLGRIVEEAPTATLFRSPHHPYTRALLDSVLTPEPEKGLPENHLGIAYPDPIDPPPGCTFHPRCPCAQDVCRKIPPCPVNIGNHMVECHFPLNNSTPKYN
ncbi:MAG: ATP-binding cassette domain-containing protein [Desulfobacteraceae bacterium]|nr:MAG: ATP-binding cassette domain-containing protein [Desulfobacteraceae bacterium]